jgi:formyl-CoA transferase
MRGETVTRLLEGCRVVESSMLLNGAVTGMMLVDLGADVIKVESPAVGDYLRLPETWHLNRQANRGKRSIAIDLKRPEGREVLYRLLETADVFLTNALAGKNEKLGIGYDQLKTLKPDIIYCQNTGFGATGPWCGIPTHGQMMDALAGAMPVRMGDDGFVVPQAFSRRSGTLAAAGESTTMGSIYAAFHIAAALAHRARTGEGCYIDLSSAHAAVASAWVAAVTQLNRPERLGWWQNEGNLRPVARYQAYITRDERFLLFCPEERKSWHQFCDLVGRPELKPEERGEDLRRTLQAIIVTRDLVDWMELARVHALPMGPINDGIAQVQEDPQIASRPMFARSTDDFVHLGQPALVDGKAWIETGPAPEHGEHGDQILRELGYGDDRIAALAGQGITKAEQPRERIAVSAIYGEE